MNKFTFVLSSIFLSGLTTGVISAVLSGLYSLIGKSVEHPHQIIPNWMIYFVVGFGIAACISLLYASYCVFWKGDMSFNLWSTIRTSAAISLGMIVLFMMFGT